MPPVFKYTNEMLLADIIILANLITQHGVINPESKIDLIVGLTRGGLIPAVYLSHKLKVPMTALDYSTRDKMVLDTDQSVSEHGEVSGSILASQSVYQSHGSYLKAHLNRLSLSGNILLVDDLADSGRTLKEVAGLLPNAKTAVLIYKEHTSVHIPNYYSKKTDSDDWIIFAWEQGFDE